jgi:ribosomal protein L37AE/L43A
MDQNKKNTPGPPPGADKPKCPFCGRRNTVTKIEDRLYDCSYCQKTFQVERKM